MNVGLCSTYKQLDLDNSGKDEQYDRPTSDHHNPTADIPCSELTQCTVHRTATREPTHPISDQYQSWEEGEKEGERDWEEGGDTVSIADVLML